MPATGTRGNARAAEQAALLTPEFPKPRARARPKTWAAPRVPAAPAPAGASAAGGRGNSGVRRMTVAGTRRNARAAEPAALLTPEFPKIRAGGGVGGRAGS